MLPVSLDSPFLIASPVLSDAYFMYKNPIFKEIKIEHHSIEGLTVVS
jgi:hypothetical protein